uniref:Ribonuclease Z n=1 Tax=Kuetzingia canaliculata TaxID=228262 RepID=A0A1Z1MPB9_KUECA|nr:ribonuclease Z [Kuetzingia canaliculata]ARW67786.1 ribonuclease Z [Kuetzingia canaliculata]
MIFRYFNVYPYLIRQSDLGFIIRLSDTKDIWIINCIEGCQFNVFNSNFKLNNLSKLIITSLHIDNISGLLGLLSSLNLIGRFKSLHIYAPIDLKYYLDLGKKYSRTNFSYVIYLHVITTGLIVNQYGCRIYAFYGHNNYDFVILQSEQYGTFCLDQARKNYFAPGPLYGKLKNGSTFLFPDGTIVNGCKFTSHNLLGCQLSFFASSFYRKQVIENTIFSRIILLN